MRPPYIIHVIKTRPPRFDIIAHSRETEVDYIL
uniref:Uncharacterized protein n=1 Tax=Siphoviridae sp. ct96x5 TaxID=2825367 RepID=A0A8S5PR66_9CAUD|nr:MAG TPA: hypothetical protein [Siphoviridae sp. ct96x5]